MKKVITAIVGLAVGVINGMLGTGGGTLVVPYLEKIGVDAQKSHATAISVILPLTIVSTFFYVRAGTVDIKSTAILAASGMAGGFVGAKLLNKIPRRVLQAVFGASMVYMGVRMLWR